MALLEQQPLSDANLTLGITSQPALDTLDIDSHRLTALANGETFGPEAVQQEETITRNGLQDVTEPAKDASAETPLAQPMEYVVDEVSADTKRPSKRISFEDFIDLNDILFEWADSYDNKDWKRLERILAPLMIVDYSIVGHERIEDLPAAEFIGMMSSSEFLGDPLVKTQHLMGARKFEYISDDEVLGSHQIRAAHQRYCADGITVENRGHGHAFIKHWYIKIDGIWKLKGLCPQIYWNEHNFDRIFISLKGQH